MRLLFIDRRDLPVVWGYMHIDVTRLRRMVAHGLPPFKMAIATERADGRYGYVFAFRPSVSTLFSAA